MAQAEAVSRETMCRVRTNVTLLERSLRGLGYEFAVEAGGGTWPYQVIQPVEPDAQVKIDRVEQRVGPIPLSVRDFLLEVGGVAFNGYLPGWDARYPDPLEVCASLDGLDAHLADMLEDPQRQAEIPREERGTAHLELSADYLHKANISGGRPYGILIPDARADAPWRFDDLHDGLYFVEYLRSVIADGGVPGWRRTPGEQPAPAIAQIKLHLVPF